MDDGIKFRIEADADDAIQGLRDVVREQGKLSDEVKESGQVADQASDKARDRTRENKKLTRSLKDTGRAERRAADGADDYGRSASSAAGNTGLFAKAASAARGALTGMIGGFIGVSGINAAMAAYERHLDAVNSRLKENAQLTRAAADAALELQFLSLVPDPTERAFAEEQAVLAGRDPSEGVRAFGSLRSKNPNADREQLKQLLTLAALKGQQTTAPLIDIAGGLSTINKFTNDPIAASNILEQAIDEAGELQVAKFVPLLAKFLSTGVNVAGLTPGQSAGFVSGITGLGLPNEEAVTSLKNIALSIKGQGTPEGSKILEREDINRDDLPTALREIAAAFSEGRIAPEELQLIGGDSALTGLAALADERILDDLLASVGRVDESGRSKTLRVSQKAAAQFGADEIQSLNLNLKQNESRLLLQRQNDTRAIRIATARAIIDRELGNAVQSGELSEVDSQAKLAAFDRVMARGNSSIVNAAEITEFEGTFFSKFDPRLLVTGGDGRIGPELGDVVQRSLQAGPDITGEGLGAAGRPVIQHINHGTIINQGRDPTRADLEVGEPLN